jgi:bifunctional isochorismate lyase / aryl carrier protein
MSAEKKLYYTPETIDQEAQKFLSDIKEFRTKHLIKIIPQKAALLVIDMQDFFTNPKSNAFIPNSRAIFPNIKKLQKVFLEKSSVVIQTRHVNTHVNTMGQMYNWWGNNLLKDYDPLAEIALELRNTRIPVITKTQYDAFWQTDLEQRLHNQKIQQVIISGVMTHLCCETTARSSFVRGFEVFFAIDATATHNRKFHSSTLYNLAHGFAVPVLTSEILENLEI